MLALALLCGSAAGQIVVSVDEARGELEALRQSVHVRDAAMLPGAQQAGGLAAAAARYRNPREGGYFSSDLEGARIVPVQVTVTNGSRVKALLRADARVGSGGLMPLAGAEVFRRTERSISAGGIVKNIFSLGFNTGNIQRSLAGANEALAANYQLKSMRDRVLGPGESLSAFLFFDREQLAAAGNLLRLRVQSLDRLAAIELVVPIQDVAPRAGETLAAGMAAASAQAQTGAVPAAASVAPVPGQTLQGQPAAAADTAPAAAVVLAIPAAPQRTSGNSVTLPNGDRYQGELLGAVRIGRGVYQFVNGDRYEGDFDADRFHGQGILAFANGDRYQGGFVKGVQQGQGVLTQANGDRYEGEFVAGVAQGRGVLVQANGDRYEGDFVAGVKHGRGVHRFANGERYEGEFRAGVQAGPGRHFFANGDRYIGSYAGGLQHGPGIYYFQSGQNKPMVFINGVLQP